MKGIYGGLIFLLHFFPSQAVIHDPSCGHTYCMTMAAQFRQLADYVQSLNGGESKPHPVLGVQDQTQTTVTLEAEREQLLKKIQALERSFQGVTVQVLTEKAAVQQHLTEKKKLQSETTEWKEKFEQERVLRAAHDQELTKAMHKNFQLESTQITLTKDFQRVQEQLQLTEVTKKTLEEDLKREKAAVQQAYAERAIYHAEIEKLKRQERQNYLKYRMQEAKEKLQIQTTLEGMLALLKRGSTPATPSLAGPTLADEFLAGATADQTADLPEIDFSLITTALTRKIKQAHLEIEELAVENDLKEHQNGQLQEQLSRIHAENTRLQKQIESIEYRLINAEQQRDMFDGEGAELRKELRAAESQIAQMRNDQKAALDHIFVLEKEEEKRARVIEQKTQEVKTEKEKNQALEQITQELEQQVETLKRNVQSLVRLNRLEVDQIAGLEQNLEELDDAEAEQEKSLQALQKTLLHIKSVLASDIKGFEAGSLEEQAARVRILKALFNT